MSATRASIVNPDQFTTFGELFKFLRRQAGLTQRELAIAVGYSTSQISRAVCATQRQAERWPTGASR